MAKTGVMRMVSIAIEITSAIRAGTNAQPTADQRADTVLRSLERAVSNRNEAACYFVSILRVSSIESPFSSAMRAMSSNSTLLFVTPYPDDTFILTSP